MGRFFQIGKTEFAKDKNLVISVDTNNKISIAQQLVFNSEGKKQEVFLKNAIQTDIEGLQKIRDMISEAIVEYQKKPKN